MKIELKEFQVDAVEQLTHRLRKAAADARDSPQTLVLSSPTGSGKTLMAIETMERLLAGDETHEADPDAVFLWVSDQPQVNEQTRRKVLEVSTMFDQGLTTTITPEFDAPRLTRGNLYFLNTQKLGRDKVLTERGDERSHTIWETIETTAKESPNHFFVIIDEAHRGTSTSPAAQQVAASIVQKLIVGAPGEVHPLPIILGISATPDRFRELLASGTRTVLQAVEVKPQVVRESGLIKERITLYSPESVRAADITMLEAAARDVRTMANHWDAYSRSNSDPKVVPILVVQVENERKKGDVSATPLGATLRAISDVLGKLPDVAIAHSFQEGSALTIEGRSIRYIAPPDIQGDPDVRVVFFKTSLNTGWDCPRAEVMMSFRSAEDSTSIAQLVGRMVRTPLARRIDGDELLNRVGLYLPHYDTTSLTDVIDYLSKPESEYRIGSDLEKGEEWISLVKADSAADSLAALSALPSYTIPHVRRSSGVRRLMKLARLLAVDGLKRDAVDAARARNLATIDGMLALAGSDPAFQDLVAGRAKLKVRAKDWLVGSSLSDGTVIELDLSKLDVEAEFEGAGRKLEEGLHRDWWQARVESGSEPGLAKRELIVLASNPDLPTKLEGTAQALTREWFAKFEEKIRGLPESRRQLYSVVRELAPTAEAHPWAIEAWTSIAIRKGRAFSRHLYVSPRDRSFSADLNDVESVVVAQELRNPEVVSWLRNVERQPWALRIPYQEDGVCRALYPDFLFVRRHRGKLITDIIDPHGGWLADVVPKAHGLADYAANHAESFGRIEIILPEGDVLRRLDLTDAAVRNAVKLTKAPEDLRAVYRKLA